MRFILSLLVFISASCFGQYSKIIFQDNFTNPPVFNNNPNLGYTNWDETCCPWSFTNSDSISSSRMGRFELRKSDPSPQPNDSKRSQMEWNGFGVPMGATWYSANITPAPWMGIDLAPEDLFDLHDKMPGNAPSNWTNPFGIWNENGRWKVHITYSVNPVSTTNPPISIYYDLGPVIAGKTINWTLNTNYSWRDSGFVKLYMDGKLVIDYKGPCAYNGALPDPYFKFGIYKWPWETGKPASSQVTRVFYFDDLKIGGRSCTIADFYTPPVVNKPPIANAGLDQLLITSNGTAQTTLKGTATDPDGDSMTYLWKTLESATGYLLTSTSNPWSISGYIKGRYVYEFQAIDAKGAIGRDTMIITVTDPNTPPVIDSIFAGTYTLPIATAQIWVAAHDNEGDSLSYKWDSAGTAVSFMPSFTKKFTVAGTYIFNVVITDKQGSSSNARTTIIINKIPDKLIINVGSRINPMTGGLIVTHYFADGTFKDYENQ